MHCRLRLFLLILTKIIVFQVTGILEEAVDSAYDYQQEIEKGERIIVGVNEFKIDEVSTEGDSLRGRERRYNYEYHVGEIDTMIENFDHSVCLPSFVDRTFSKGV